jgi:hypothetical protein
MIYTVGMKSKFGCAVALCALIAFTGCVDDATKITVNTDGSGMIEKTIILSKHLVEFIQSSGMMQGTPAQMEASILNENSLRGGAAQMGQDVSFVSAVKITTVKGNGYQVAYTFKDVNKLKLNQSPSADMNIPAAGAAQQSAPEYITFKFVKGPPAFLTVILPKPGTAAQQQAQKPYSQQDLDEMMKTMRPLYMDLRIVFSVAVQGTVTETNASYVAGSTVTVVDMDFSKILADDANFKKLASMQTQSISEVQRMVKAMPGVKLDTHESINIKFQ